MKMNFLKAMIAVAFAMLICMPIAFAQTDTGSINGNVTDPSGAVVVGATVVAHNISTGVDTPTTTNNDGSFHISFLPIGQYLVTIQAKGFGTETVPAFNLEVLQAATFNVKLSMGSSSTTVDVSAAAPILNTNDDTLADNDNFADSSSFDSGSDDSSSFDSGSDFGGSDGS